MSFAEEHCGTNAIALASKLKVAIHTIPQQHYCEFLRSSYFYSIPLWNNKNLLGFLAIVCLEEKMQNELFVITDLLGYRIENEFMGSYSTVIASKRSQVKLSDKQLNILRLLATGKPDKAIASYAGLKICTIKYHKKNIFKRLDVSCSIEAVIKALKLNIISIEQINLY